MKLIHRVAEHQVLGLVTRHLGIPETELIDTAFETLADDKRRLRGRNHRSRRIGFPSLHAVGPHVDTVGKGRDGQLSPLAHRQFGCGRYLLCSGLVDKLTGTAQAQGELLVTTAPFKYIGILHPLRWIHQKLYGIQIQIIEVLDSSTIHLSVTVKAQGQVGCLRNRRPGI